MDQVLQETNKKKSKPFTVSLSSVKSRGLKVNKKTMDRLEKLFKSSLKSNKLGKSNQKGGFIATLLAATAPLWLPTVVNTVKKIVQQTMVKQFVLVSVEEYDKLCQSKDNSHPFKEDTVF